MIARAVCCWFAVLLSGAVHAQLRDPTEPPPALREDAAVADRSALALSESAPRLQSVLISHRRRIAVIDGETVRVGQLHRGALVESISATRVVLKRGKVREVLRLYPADPAGLGKRQ